jgi:hypothetical protein
MPQQEEPMKMKYGTLRSIGAGSLIAIVCSLVAAAQTAPTERVAVYRTIEDTSVSPQPISCPYADANVFLGAIVRAVETRATDGQDVSDRVAQVGTAAACARVTSLAPGATAPFYIEFSLDDGSYRADGTCTVTSNNVPVSGLVLAGCALKIIDAPAGVQGGSFTSNSIFNPFRLPGFNTGSVWTRRTYSTP